MATGENRVRWDLLDHRTYEDMVSVLLSRMYPKAVRMDGSGGDEGQDCYWDTDTGRHVFELKSFTGRVTKSRRAQITRSLDRAAKLGPAHWHLVLPIDPTPGENEWFSGLRDKYTFPLEWRGKTWLDDRIAEHPELHRYFVNGAADEVLERLAELKMEELAFANGVPDAIERLMALSVRLNEIDPYYFFSISIAHNVVSVSIEPRYAGALTDRPIRGTINGSFPDTSQGRAALEAFKDALDFGLPFSLDAEYVESVVLDAPAGLGGTIDNPTISMTPSPQQVPMTMAATVVALDGSSIARLPLQVTDRFSGLDGFELRVSDRSGWFRCTVRARMSDRSLNLIFAMQAEEGILPSELAPAMGFAANLRTPHTLTLEMLDPPGILASGLEISSDALVSHDQHTLIENLATLQRHSGVHFDLPQELSADDLREIDEGTRLLRGEMISLPVSEATLSLRPNGEEPAVVRSALESSEPVAILIRSDVSVTVARHDLVLGPGAIHYPAATVANSEHALAAWNQSDETIELILKPIEVPTMTLETTNEPPRAEGNNEGLPS